MLRDLVQFVQFKKREKHPWRRKRFSDISGCIEIEHWCEIKLCLTKDFDKGDFTMSTVSHS